MFNIFNHQLLAGLGYLKHRLSLPCGIELHIDTIGAHQTQLNWNNQRQLFTLTRGGRATLLKIQGIGIGCGIIFRSHPNNRGASLFIPAAELSEVAATGIFHCADKLLNSDCLTIMAIKIQICSFAIGLSTQQAVIHAHNLGAFFIHSQCVKIIDLHIGVRLHLMGHRATVFSKLMSAQIRYIFNALYRWTVHIR